MRSLRPAFSLALLGPLLAGCAVPELATLERTEAVGSAFTRAMSREYLRFARFEALEMRDWLDARHFARKGLVAAAGVAPMPERPAEWRLGEAAQPRLAAARDRLAALFAAGLRQRAPEIAARAQLGLDCWIEQEEEGWQYDHIAACRERFQRAVLRLEGQAGPLEARFGFDSVVLDRRTRERIAGLAAEARRLGVPRITVIGHADRAGPAAYNLTLSLRRADAVRATLVAGGFPASRIAVSAVGETRPRVATADGVALRANRRVEILFHAYAPR